MAKKYHGKIQEKNEDEKIDFTYFWTYLGSERGHEVVTRIVGVIEDLKKVTLERQIYHARFERYMQVGVIALVVIATSILTYLNKFDASIGVLFGTLVGYLFGRKSF